MKSTRCKDCNLRTKANARDSELYVTRHVEIFSDRIIITNDWNAVEYNLHLIKDILREKFI